MNDSTPREPEVIEPEVLPPEQKRSGPGASPPRSGTKSRLAMILVGFLLDGLDLLTFGPLGIRLGFIVGFLAAFFLFSSVGIPMKKRLLYSLAAGVYCLIPGTERWPLGTILAALMGLR